MCNQFLIDEALDDQNFVAGATMIACPRCAVARPAPNCFFNPSTLSSVRCLVPPLGCGYRGSGFTETEVSEKALGASACERARKIGARADAAAGAARRRHTDELAQLFAATAAAERIVNKTLGSPAEPATAAATALQNAAATAKKPAAKKPKAAKKRRSRRRRRSRKRRRSRRRRSRRWRRRHVAAAAAEKLSKALGSLVFSLCSWHRAFALAACGLGGVSFALGGAARPRSPARGAGVLALRVRRAFAPLRDTPPTPGRFLKTPGTWAFVFGSHPRSFFRGPPGDSGLYCG